MEYIKQTVSNFRELSEELILYISVPMRVMNMFQIHVRCNLSVISTVYISPGIRNLSVITLKAIKVSGFILIQKRVIITCIIAGILKRPGSIKYQTQRNMITLIL